MGGSYAPPLPKEKAGIKTMQELVKEAISVTINNDNIFLETSILASPLKRQLIIDALEAIQDKLLLGTDFPATVNQLVGSNLALEEDYVPTIISEETFLLKEGVLPSILKKIYLNIHNIF